ncbi:MAG: RidA family protein [Burkholderiaceae bacterium]
MRQEIDTGLPSLGQPFSWAVGDGPMVYTSHGPVTAEGKILQGDITAQTRLTLDNLRRTMEAAGGSLDDVLQVQLYLLDVADMKPVDAVYAEVFRAPYPSRSTAVVAALVAPGMRIELLATARIAARKA